MRVSLIMAEHIYISTLYFPILQMIQNGIEKIRKCDMYVFLF